MLKKLLLKEYLKKYAEAKQIRIKTSMLRSNLCDYKYA